MSPELGQHACDVMLRRVRRQNRRRRRTKRRRGGGGGGGLWRLRAHLCLLSQASAVYQSNTNIILSVTHTPAHARRITLLCMFDLPDTDFCPEFPVKPVRVTGCKQLDTQSLCNMLLWPTNYILSKYISEFLCHFEPIFLVLPLCWLFHLSLFLILSF